MAPTTLPFTWSGLRALVAVAAVLAALVLCAGPTGSHAWGRFGHKAVADVAYYRLNAHAKAMVKNYIGNEWLADIATYPDQYDHDPQGLWSTPLHYVDLPRDAVEYKPIYCQSPPCVVEAIHNYTKRLSMEGDSGPACKFDGAEPCALSFLVHFVGDIHQPLHVSYGDDMGGNLVNVTFFGAHTNLHSVWDSLMIQRYADSWMTLSYKIRELIKQNPSAADKYAQVMDVAQWANESFNYTRTDVYQFQPSQARAASSVPVLGEWYYDKNMPIVEQRLIAASVRLAEVLNTLFP